MKSFTKIALLPLVLILILSGCSRSPEKEILGAWQMVYGEESYYLEFTDNRLIGREDPEDTPETIDYRFTDLQKGKFIIEIAEPGSSVYNFFMEGHFEKKGIIKVTRAVDLDDGETFELIRVKNLEKEIEQALEKQKASEARDELERKFTAENAAKEEKANKEKEQQDKVKKDTAKELEKETEVGENTEQDEEENRNTYDEDVVDVADEPTQESTDETYEYTETVDNSIKVQYLNEANHLHDGIYEEMKIHSPHDLDPQFYGQYFEAWDGLLNEIWAVLKDSLPTNEFEQLKSEQISWIKTKEKNFNERSDATSAERGESLGYLTLDTKDRVFYLIDYLQ